MAVEVGKKAPFNAGEQLTSPNHPSHDEKFHFSVSLARLIEMQVDRSMGTPVVKFTATKKTDILQHNSPSEFDTDHTSAPPSSDLSDNISELSWPSSPGSNPDNLTTTCMIVSDNSGMDTIEKSAIQEVVSEDKSPAKVRVKQPLTSYFENRPDSSLPVKKRLHSQYKSRDVKDAIHTTSIDNEKLEKVHKRKTVNKSDKPQSSSSSHSLLLQRQVSDDDPTRHKSPRLASPDSTNIDVNNKSDNHSIDKLLSSEEICQQNCAESVTVSDHSSGSTNVQSEMDLEHNLPSSDGGVNAGQWIKYKEWRQNVPIPTEASSLVNEESMSALKPVELAAGEAGPEEGQRLTELQPMDTCNHFTKNVAAHTDDHPPTDAIACQLSILDYHMLRSLQNIESHKYLPRNNKVCKSLSMSKRNYFKYSDLVELIIEKRLDVSSAERKKVEPLKEAIIDSGSSDEDLSYNNMLPPPQPSRIRCNGNTSNVVTRQSVIQTVGNLDEERAGRFYWSKKITDPQPLPELDEVARRNLCTFVPGRILSTKSTPDTSVVECDLSD